MREYHSPTKFAASTRVTNPECLLRSADIMAAVAVVLRIQGA